MFQLINPQLQVADIIFQTPAKGPILFSTDRSWSLKLSSANEFQG